MGSSKGGLSAQRCSRPPAANERPWCMQSAVGPLPAATARAPHWRGAPARLCGCYGHMGTPRTLMGCATPWLCRQVARGAEGHCNRPSPVGRRGTLKAPRRTDKPEVPARLRAAARRAFPGGPWVQHGGCADVITETAAYRHFFCFVLLGVIVRPPGKTSRG